MLNQPEVGLRGLSSKHVFWSWTVTVAVGEFLGFADMAASGSNGLRALMATNRDTIGA
jgi:hypothetical protein